MKFTLYTAGCTGNAANCSYPNAVEVTNPDELARAVARDHTFAACRDSYRSISNFLWSNVLPMDCDNDHSEHPEDWITGDNLTQLFSGVCLAVVPSRHHNLPKNGKAARPRFHVLFPIPECRDAAQYVALKTALQRKHPFFDGKALDAARFFFGSACTPDELLWQEGACTVDDLLKECEAPVLAEESDEMSVSSTSFSSTAGDSEDAVTFINDARTIPVGSRNNTLSRFAGRILVRYGNCDKARQLFRERAEQCDPPLSGMELRTIWSSAVKFAGRIQAQADYISPEEYSAPADSMKPEDYSDMGEAAAFVRAYGSELHFTKATDYLRHDGVCWREEPQLALGAVEEFLDLQLREARDAVESAEDALIRLGVDRALVKSRSKVLGKLLPGAQLHLLGDLMKADNYYRFVMRYRNYKNLVNVLETAKPLTAMDIADFDGKPELLNTPDGTCDLSKGMAGLREHRSGDYITKVTALSPGDTGTALWQEALNTFFCNDPDLIDYVQMQVGMVAVGKVYQEHMIIAYGGGANGKSTFWNVIFRVLGSYAGKISAETLTMNCKRNVKPEMAELKGKRLIIASELEDGMRLNTAIVKQLCSTDEILAEKKYRDPFYFVPSHTLVLYTNHLPKVGVNDDGIWRRLIVIPFNAKITGSSDIKNYADDLYENAGPAILKWIIEGAQKAIAAGFHTPMPQAVQEAVGFYRDSNDWLAQFIEDHCEVDPSYQAQSGTLYQTYRSACLQNGEYIRSTTDFYGALERAGFKRRRIDRGRFIVGLRLKEGQDFPAL